LQARVYGAETVSDSQFIDTIARNVLALTDALLIVAQDVDALRAELNTQDS
jgi:hypothetical protein